MNKIKLLVVTNLYPSDDNRQYGTFVKEQVDSLLIYFSNQIQIDVHFINGRKSKFNYLKSLFVLPKIVKKNNYDLVHVHYGLTLISVLFVYIPIIVTYHGSDLSIWWVRLFSNILKLKACQAVVVSSSMVKTIKTNTIIPCGINERMFTVNNDVLNRRINKYQKGGRIIVLFPSNPKNKVKNYPLFCKICEVLRKKKIYLEIKHLCNVQRHKVPELYKNSDLLLLTSFSEGSPTVIKEAIASKLPFVSVDVGDVKEWVDQIKFGVLSQSNEPEFIADITINLLESLKNIEDFDNSKVINRLSTFTAAKKLKALYEKAVDKNR